MADLTGVFKPYSTDIYNALEAREQRKSRRLGGSMIGEKCDRKLWYMFRQVKTQKFPGRTLRIFETGHEQEARIIRELRESGHAVTNVGEDQVEFTWCSGHLVDKPDGVVDGKYIVDIKTMNDKNFKKLAKEGISLKYLAQMALHVEGAIEQELIPKTSKGLFFAVNKNDEDFEEIKVPRNARLARAMIEKAERIISAPYPPGRLSEDPSFFECRFCDFHDLCHERKQGEFEFSCRTCVFSDPIENGKWACSKYNLKMASGFDEIESCPEYKQIENS